MDGSASLLPAAVLRSTICADAKLSKRAASLLARECNALAMRLLERAVEARSLRGGVLEAADVWEALLTDTTNSWLVNRLGFWTSPDATGTPSLPPDVPLPLPPPGLTPDSHLRPRLLWLRAPLVAGAAEGTLPLHPSLLENDDRGADEDDLVHASKRARREHAEDPRTPLHPSLLALRLGEQTTLANPLDMPPAPDAAVT